MMTQVLKCKGRRYWVLQASELYANEEAKIDWATLLPPSAGDRDQRSQLISASKDLLQAMIEAPWRRGGSLGLMSQEVV